MYDPLGDRMKQLEAATRLVLPPGTFMLLRVDGRAFHTFTRGLRRPFDPDLSTGMDAAATALCEEIDGALCAYVQSDEITVVATDTLSNGAQLWFGGVVQKVASVSASIATAAFNAAFRHPTAGRHALFDARVFGAGRADVAANLAWRQADCRRNAISMLCHAHLPRKAVAGVPTRVRRQMLADAGIEIDSHEPGDLHGRLVRKVWTRGTVEWEHSVTGETHVEHDVLRSHWQTEPAPELVADGAASELLGELIDERANAKAA